ncbi:flagellar hook-associated protein FlgL [Cohnella abietis]|uniref:Flagellar hook-associated protein FlgL n=1 Tax=Cohnella abietis TaxID=2507935 RepID=A0A3T1DDI7_9BACL|nr:flagellar hook-associated protein FlgL [Cohnella abietis]BBI36149.1 flagellar hook-associated protein FlgL [Cohnella abietis]
MTIRVTSGMIHNQLIRNLNNNYNRMSATQEQIETGRKINRASDDPVGITYALRYRSELSMNDQYQRNITTATSSVDHVDTVLNQINELLQRAKELAVRGISDSSSKEAREAIGKELDGIFKQAVTLGNDQVNGKYTFNGQLTTTQPYDTTTAGTTDTDEASILLPLAPGVEIQTNISGNSVFGASTDADNVFTVFKELRDAMNSNDSNAARSAMERLDTRFNTFLGIRSEVGARANRIEMLDNRNQDLNQSLNGLIAKTEDTDIAQAIMNLQRDENVYQASLSVGSKIIQPSLVDYLR